MKTLALMSALVLSGGTLAAQNVERHVSGSDVSKRTTIVVEKEAWQKDLDALKKRATDEKKLIFWLQIVGELGGGL